MLFSFALPALALTVPLRATFKEDVAPGETALASVSTTAVISAVSNPSTGSTFSASADELTANRREATGKEGISFVEAPKSSVRSWAIYFIDADGAEVGDPELVDVSFDENGNGSVAARSASSRLGSLTVKPTDEWRGGFSAAQVKVTAQDSGANAAYIGIVEMKSSGSALANDPEMSTMSSDIFAAYQALDLDAIVSLDSYTIQLEGSVDITGLTVAADGTVEGGQDLEWEVGFYTGQVSCQKDAGCAPVVSQSMNYLQAVGKLKKKATVAPKVALKDSNIIIDSTDASFDLVVQGDVRDLEISAAMDVYQSDKAVAARDVVALDPRGYGVQSKSTDDDDDDTGMIIDIIIDVDTDGLTDFDNQGPATPWTVMAAQAFDVVVLDGEGQVVSTQSCQLQPTPSTYAGTSKRDVLVGECTQDLGGTEVRRLRASIGAAGWVRWSMDLAGPVFAESRTVTTCEKGGDCKTQTVSVLDGTVELQRNGITLLSRHLAVTETDFDLPFLFDADIRGMDTVVAIDLYSPVPLTWSVADGVVTAMNGSTVVASFDAADIDLVPTGDCKAKEWAVTTATVPEGASEGPVTLQSTTGPGRFVCR